MDFKKLFLFNLVVLIGLLPAQKIDQKINKKINKQTPLLIKGDTAKFYTKKGIIEFKNNVEIKHEDSKLTCDKVIAFSNKVREANKVDCYGKIIWKDVKVKAKLICGFVSYIKAKTLLIAKDKPILYVRDSKGILSVIKADKFDIFVNKKTAYAYNNASIKRKDTYSSASYIKFDYLNDEIILEGKPQITQNKNTFSGKKIVMFLKENKLNIINDVNANVMLKE